MHVRRHAPQEPRPVERRIGRRRRVEGVEVHEQAGEPRQPRRDVPARAAPTRGGVLVEPQHAARAEGHPVGAGAHPAHRLVLLPQPDQLVSGPGVEDRQPLVQERQVHQAARRRRRAQRPGAGRPPQELPGRVVGDQRPLAAAVGDQGEDPLTVGGEPGQRHPRRQRLGPQLPPVVDGAGGEPVVLAGDEEAPRHHDARPHRRAHRPQRAPRREVVRRDATVGQQGVRHRPRRRRGGRRLRRQRLAQRRRIVVDAGERHLRRAAASGDEEREGRAPHGVPPRRRSRMARASFTDGRLGPRSPCAASAARASSPGIAPSARTSET